VSENAAEFQEKASRIRDLMRARGWDWLALSAPDSLAWAACGARPYVNLLGPAGVFPLPRRRVRVVWEGAELLQFFFKGLN